MRHTKSRRFSLPQLQRKFLAFVRPATWSSTCQLKAMSFMNFHSHIFTFWSFSHLRWNVGGCLLFRGTRINRCSNFARATWDHRHWLYCALAVLIWEAMARHLTRRAWVGKWHGINRSTIASGWHRLFLPTADCTSDLGHLAKQLGALGAPRSRVLHPDKNPDLPKADKATWMRMWS